ncbi:uncharacterized protein LOC135372803 [Ornithodoros turicata]|uniref:uncharacterized protein LOC135372803 n=1 Tax=Ornithodoros turicata TaxID=34597 RepID=UPI0031394DA2
MSEITCLVVHGKRKKVIAIGGEHKLCDLEAAIQRTSLKNLASKTQFQVFNKRFKEYVDVDDDTTLQGDDLIHILSSEKDDAPPGHSQAGPSVPENQPLNVVRLEQPRPVAQLPYIISEPPRDIDQEVKILTGNKVPDPLRTKIVRWLYSDILRYTLYPAKLNLYYESARQLVLKYPALKDSTGSGFGSWQRSINFRTRNERKKMTEVPEVAAAKERRQKSSRKMPSSDQPTEVYTKTGRPSFMPSCAGEDDISIEGHKQLMIREMRKNAQVSSALIHDSMERTASARRTWIIECPRSAQDILAQWPALNLREEICSEFKRITGVDLECSMQVFISNHRAAVLSCAAQRHSATHVVERHE